MHSPITMRTQFVGHDQIRALMDSVFAAVENIRYFEDVGDAATRALFYSARVGRPEVEEATLVRLDDDALITEIRLWFRPLPGLAAVMGRLGPPLAREHGRARAALVTALTSPLTAATRVGDALGVALARPRQGALPKSARPR